MNHGDWQAESDGAVRVLGTAYGHWHTDPDGIDRQAVFAITGHDDTGTVWTVHVGRRAASEDFAMPPTVAARGLPQDAGAFLSVMLDHSVTGPSRPWPRKKPRVDLPEVEGVLS